MHSSMIVVSRINNLIKTTPAVRTITHYTKEIYNQPREQTTHGYYIIFPEVSDEKIHESLLSSIENAAPPPLNSVTIGDAFKAASSVAFSYANFVADHSDKFNDLKINRNFDTVVVPLSERFGATVEISRFLTQLANYRGDTADTFEEAENVGQALAALQSAFAEMYKHNELHKAIKEVAQDKGNLDEWQQQLVRHHYRLGKDNGLELSEPDKRSLDAVSCQLRDYEHAYLMNIVKVYASFNHPLSNIMLIENAPHYVLAELLKIKSVDADAIRAGPWNVGLHPRQVYPFMRYCKSRPRRESTWHNIQTRASFKTHFSNNSLPIEDIRTRRIAIAQKHGFDNYSQYALQNTMAGEVGVVREFLDALSESLKPTFVDAWEQAQQYATRVDKTRTMLKTHDLFYYGRLLPQVKNEVDFNLLERFFEVEIVFEWLKMLVSKWFNVQFEDVTSNFETWHPSVRVFEVVSVNSNQSNGHIYVELHARDNKHNVWHAHLGRCKDSLRPATPIVYFNGAAYKRADGRSLLHIEELKQIFREFGRAMSYLMIGSPYPDLSALTCHEGDVLETVPILFEKLLYEPKLLSSLAAADTKSGDVLSSDQAGLFIKTAREQEFFETYRRIFLSDFDIRLNSISQRQDKFWLDLYRELWNEYFDMPYDKLDFFVCNFTPIFTANLASLYYSDLWSEMIACDIVARLREKNGGIITIDSEGTNEILTAFLQMNESAGCFKKAFRLYTSGQDPSVKPILDNYALKLGGNKRSTLQPTNNKVEQTQTNLSFSTPTSNVS